MSESSLNIVHSFNVFYSFLLSAPSPPAPQNHLGVWGNGGGGAPTENPLLGTFSLNCPVNWRQQF